MLYQCMYFCASIKNAYLQNAVPKYVFSMRVLKMPIFRMYPQTAVENNFIYFIFVTSFFLQGEMEWAGVGKELWIMYIKQ